MTKIKDALIARESMRHKDSEGKVYEGLSGRRGGAA